MFLTCVLYIMSELNTLNVERDAVYVCMRVYGCLCSKDQFMEDQNQVNCKTAVDMGKTEYFFDIRLYFSRRFYLIKLLNGNDHKRD